MCVMTDYVIDSQSPEDSPYNADEINQCPLFAMVQWVSLLLALALLFVWSYVIYHLLNIFVNAWPINCFSHSSSTFLHSKMPLMDMLKHVLARGMWDDSPVLTQHQTISHTQICM